MKKIIISTCLSITMLAYSNFSLCLVNADSTPGIEQWANPSGISQCIEGVAFDDLITSFGDDAFVYRYSNNKKVIVVTSDGMQKHYTNSNVWGKNYTVVKMRPGTEPPVQEINMELNAGDNLIVKFYKISDSDEYRFFVIGEDYQDTVIKILKNNDDVISIDNYREITEDVFRFAELYVKTDVAVEEFIKEYSVFELNDTSEYMKESAKEKGFTLGFSFGNYELSPELYEAFIKLQNSGMEYGAPVRCSQHR